MVNLAFADQPVSILCPYNAAELPAQALVDAGLTHPGVRDIDGQQVSSDYTAPGAVVARIAEQRTPPPPDARVFEFDVVAHARDFATQCAAKAGLPDERLTDLIIAISELGGDSIAHTGSGGRCCAGRKTARSCSNSATKDTSETSSPVVCGLRTTRNQAVAC